MHVSAIKCCFLIVNYLSLCYYHMEINFKFINYYLIFYHSPRKRSFYVSQNIYTILYLWINCLIMSFCNLNLSVINFCFVLSLLDSLQMYIPCVNMRMYLLLIVAHNNHRNESYARTIWICVRVNYDYNLSFICLYHLCLRVEW